MCLVLRICSGFFVNAIAPLLSHWIRVVGILPVVEDGLEGDSKDDSKDDSEDDSWASCDSIS
jgi:hypothetical protein